MTMFQGCLTALITPFKDGKIDMPALAALVEAQIAAGIDGLVPCGSTGESATLSHDEHEAVVREVIRVARKRVPVIAGTGSNSTSEATRLTKAAQDAGADAALLISPYYNKPTQDGIVAHYAAVAQATTIPLIAYNIQGRTASNITADTMARLAQIPRLIGVKEASGSVAQVCDIIQMCGPDFGVWAGDDSVTLPIMAAGGCGVITVAANLIPDRMVALSKAMLNGDLTGARREHLRLLPLLRALFVETNPIGIKTALAMRGQCQDEFRLPLTRMTETNRESLRATLHEQGLV
jgi:4-hydroxy-tetrahydrodipicolinate synthase